MSFLENYFYLPEYMALVEGAKYSSLVDLSTGSVTCPNSSAMKIIQMGESGLKISEAVEELKFEIEAADILRFIWELCSQGLIRVSLSPKRWNENISTPPRLEFLWIEVTSACNQHCIHCYADECQTECEGLPFGEITKVIDDAAASGCKAIQFTGGECTLRRDLAELIKYARSSGFLFIELFTNGTLLDESMIKFLASEKVHVAISLHAHTDTTHDDITGLKGSFKRTMNSLRLLIAYGVPVRCKQVAMKENEHELEATNSFLRQLGVQTQQPDLIIPCGRGLLKDNWPETYGLRTIQSQPCFLATREIFDKNRRGNSCWFGKAAVTYSGDVIPCPFARNQVTGNVTKQKLSEIVFSECMQNLWGISHDQIEVCKDCEYRYFCKDCRPWAYGLTGNILAKNPRCTYDPYVGEWKSAKEALMWRS